ncbi:hypothetical protein [Modestobacter versicolor]|uniref:Lipoprotein n=1 Tax=Modestobacter versicolor TaxID=429133 RepID=A0A323VP96_9ACTN|nr:hypothetical protein [Modestobacter versicolor]MBB3677866.1 hypothetical protein [Modestobacter versicolor]PZA21308.1 hypothetical protein DMO24_10955 [Modestobacter versicolor]
MRRVAVGLVLVLAGCGSTDPVAAPAPSSSSAAVVQTLPEVPGIAAEAVQLRTDAAVGGQVQVRVTDTGPAPFTVTAVQLDSPGFAPLPPRAVTARYAPGRTIDLPTPFGAVDCSAAVDPVGARLTVVRPDGAVEELRVPLTGDTMAQVHAGACAVADVLAVVGIAVEDLADAGETMTGEVVLTRRSGDEPVEVTRLGGSVVLEPVPDGDLPVTLAAEERELRVPVTFDAARCDPHALAETKKPFVFPLAVTVGDGESVPVDLPLDDAQEGRLQDLLDRVCTD